MGPKVISRANRSFSMSRRFRYRLYSETTSAITENVMEMNSNQ